MLWINNLLHQQTNNTTVIEDDELLTLAQISKRLLRNHSIELLGACSDFMAFMQALGKLCLLTFEYGKEDEDLYQELIDEFLDIWATLVQEIDIFHEEQKMLKKPPSLIELTKLSEEISKVLFSTYLDYVLFFAEKHALDEEEEEHGLKDWE